MRVADLQAHEQGEGAADEEEDDAGKQELNADDLVIFGEDVFAEEAQLRWAWVSVECEWLTLICSILA